MCIIILYVYAKCYVCVHVWWEKPMCLSAIKWKSWRVPVFGYRKLNILTKWCMHIVLDIEHHWTIYNAYAYKTKRVIRKLNSLFEIGSLAHNRIKIWCFRKRNIKALIRKNANLMYTRMHTTSRIKSNIKCFNESTNNMRSTSFNFHIFLWNTWNAGNTILNSLIAAFFFRPTRSCVFVWVWVCVWSFIKKQSIFIECILQRTA